MSDEVQEATITITIRKSGETWSSTHHLANIDPLVAAVIMMDVGRDLILAHHFHGHDHAAKEVPDGDAPAAG